MRILLVSSEVAPLASSGVIGKEVGELGRALRDLGHEVSAVIPCYREARERGKLRKTGVKFNVPVGTETCSCQILETTTDGLQVFLVRRDEFFDRSGMYGNAEGDYQDNAARFIFFTKAAVELARRMDPAPEVVHANGWQSALTPLYIRESQLTIPVALSPRGLEFQGNFWSYDFGLTNLPASYFSAQGIEFFGSMNFLKGGILFSQAVVLPGELAAGACQDRTYGQGLHQVLRENNYKIVGIPEPEPKPFSQTKSPKSPFPWETPGSGKDVLVIGSATRGSGSLFGTLDQIVPAGARVGMIGPVVAEERSQFEFARRKHAPAFVFHEELDADAVDAALATADFLLLPDAADPFQPWLDRALAAGVVPVAKQCLGLNQYVEPRRAGAGNGFVFWQDGIPALADIMYEAFATSPGEREEISKLCKAKTVTRRRSAEAHSRLYERLLAST